MSLTLHALQNGFLGIPRSTLFHGEPSEARVRIPVACWLIRTPDSVILFDTGLSPRAVPGLARTDPLAGFTDEDLLVRRLASVGLEPDAVDVVVLSHLHFDHAGGAFLFPKSELLVQHDEYANALHPPAFYASNYYRKNFDLPGHRWRLIEGDCQLAPGVTVLRSDGHTPGHQSLLVELDSAAVVLAGDCCYWQQHFDEERIPGLIWDARQALLSIKRLKTIVRLLKGRLFPGHDPVFWQTVKQPPDYYR